MRRRKLQSIFRSKVSGGAPVQLNTFSIVARCSRTGALGVAVTTAVPAVGAVCPYVAQGIGAASTQAWVNPYLAIGRPRPVACWRQRTRCPRRRDRG